MSDTIKVNVLRTFQRGALYCKKGAEGIEIPAELAANLAKGSKPAVEIVGKPAAKKTP